MQKGVFCRRQLKSIKASQAIRSLVLDRRRPREHTDRDCNKQLLGFGKRNEPGFRDRLSSGTRPSLHKGVIAI